MNKSPYAELPPSTEAAVPLPRGMNWVGLRTVFGLSASRMLRGRRMFVLAGLFALPTLITILAQNTARNYQPDRAEQAFVFALIPQALLPLAALVYASGMVQDEIEEQTLTYLLIRPIPRWMIYAMKLVATLLITSLLCAVGTATCLFTAHRFDFSAEALAPSRVLTIVGLMSLSIATYCSLFGLMSLLVRRTMVLGVIYIIIFEGVLANIDFVVRKLTIMYYFRTLTIRDLGQKSDAWNIDLQFAPTSSEAFWTLLISAVVFGFVASMMFDRREFRMKTPEGS